MNTVLYLKIFIIICLLGGNIQTKELSFQEAVSLALEHSYSLKKAQAESEVARRGLNSAESERMPTLSLQALASYKDEVTALEIELPGVSFSRDFGFKETYQADLKISLPLYTGGKISNGINIARAQYDYQQALLDADMDKLYLLTRVTYLKLYMADKMLDASRSALTRSEIIYNDVKSLLDAGAADSIDIFEANLLLNNARLNLENTNTERRKTELELSIRLGLSPDESITIVDQPKAPEEYKTEFTQIDPGKPELTALGTIIKLNEYKVSLSRADYYPTLAVFGAYSYGKPNIDPFKDVFNDNFSIGANLSWSFNLGGKSGAKTAMAGYRVKAAEESYSILEENLTRQARIALENLKLAYRQYQTAFKNHELSKRNFQRASEKQKAGVLSNNRLLEIETDLTASEAKLNSTGVNYHIVLSQYYYLAGNNKLKEGI